MELVVFHCLSVSPSVYLSLPLSVSLSICLYVSEPVSVFVCLFAQKVVCTGRSPLVRNEGRLCWELKAVPPNLFSALSRLACFTHRQEFCLANIWLHSSFNLFFFLLSSSNKSLHVRTSELDFYLWFHEIWLDVSGTTFDLSDCIRLSEKRKLCLKPKVWPLTPLWHASCRMWSRREAHGSGRHPADRWVIADGGRPGVQPLLPTLSPAGYHAVRTHLLSAVPGSLYGPPDLLSHVQELPGWGKPPVPARLFLFLTGMKSCA